MRETQVVYKYPLQLGSNEIPMPKIEKVVHFGLDGVDQLCVWVLHSDLNRTENSPELFEVVGTGMEVDLSAVHEASTVDDIGLVWHLFSS